MRIEDTILALKAPDKQRIERRTGRTDNPAVPASSNWETESETPPEPPREFTLVSIGHSHSGGRIMRMRALLAALVLISGLGLSVRGDDPKPDSKSNKANDNKADAKDAQADPKVLTRMELDKRIAKIAYDAADAGTKLYAAGNYEGCFRLYQGALMGLVPLLDHRPKLAAFAKDRLEKAATLDNIKGSFALREALDAVQKETHEASLPPKKTLWERLGDEKGVRAVIKDFLATTVKDDSLDPTRNGKYKWDAKSLENAENVLVDMAREYTGGPAKATIPNLRAILPGTNITDSEFDKLQKHLYDAMTKNKVPDEEMREVLQIFRAMRPFIVGK